jgi:eukaryotic-like serine/threonine-protein kinase
MTEARQPQDEVARWQMLEQAFADAIALPRLEQAAKVMQLRATDSALADELEELLAAATEPGSMRFEKPEIAPHFIEPAAAAERRLGEQFGPFRLEAVLGSGGMGEVYRAQRHEGFEQTVAVKLLRAAMGGTIFAQRFVRERATLARLNHPHIAGLVDGGTTTDGTPWLAMEYIDGLTLLDYCAQVELSVRQKIRLMLEVAEAVQFAHQQLVVHRDLKPGNIMVRADGHASLLDFGIAKLLVAEDAQDGLLQEELTLPQMPIFTPEYASPEQMRGEVVGTASDIYALGVILFRLLSGGLPFCADDRTSFDLARIVSEEAPPSLCSLVPRFPRDLDAIVAHCLRKEPARRYPTVQALADDLERWLRGLPVKARPDSMWYRGRRFFMRNRVAVSLTALVLIVSGTGLAAWLEQSRVATRKGLTAGRVSEFLIDFFGKPDPWAQGLSDMSMEDFFTNDLETLFEDLNEEPQVARELAAALGRVLLNLGDEKRAIPLLTRARDAVADAATADPISQSDINFDLGVAARRAGQLLAAETALRASLTLRQEAFGEKHEEVASAWNTLGLVHHTMGEFDQAETEYLHALELRELLHGAYGKELASTLNNLGALALDAQRNEEAIAFFQRARDIQTRLYQHQEHPDLATTLNNLGMAYQTSGRLDEAEKLFLESLAMRRRILPADHPHLAGSLNNLGLIEEQRGRLQEAALLFREALALASAKAPQGHPLLQRIRENLEAVSE